MEGKGRRGVKWTAQTNKYCLMVNKKGTDKRKEEKLHVKNFPF